jgi:hypothetical protein
MMTLPEIIHSIESLSAKEQQYLFEFLRQKQQKPRANHFGLGLQKFRQAIESEGIIFTDEDFTDLRDRSPGREIKL